MTPQEALGAAFLTAIPDETWESTYPFISVTAEFTEAILDALAADGWTVARTQDARDGEALRLLSLNVTTGFFMKYDRLFTNVPPSWSVRLPFGGAETSGTTIAAAADACREAIEATRK